MAVTWHDFADGTYALTGGANIGVAVKNGQAVMVDAGLDRDSAKKALRQIEALNAELKAVLLTHGHTDHFGGVGWVAEHTGAEVYAPVIEGAFAETPILEPLFLHGGAAPIEQLTDKFTLARQASPRTQPVCGGTKTIAGMAVTIVPLPGHSPNQVGYGIGDTLFCGDVIFPESTLKRHPILFMYDFDAWEASLEAMLSQSYKHYVPGHGDIILDAKLCTQLTAHRLRELRSAVLQALHLPQEPQAVLRAVAMRYDVTFDAPALLLLAQTTINAVLTSLQRSGEAEVMVVDNRLLWRRTNG